MHLAQINVARLTYGPDDRRSAGFMRNLEKVNGIAEQSPGFVWRLKDEGGGATVKGYDDPHIIINLSVWRSAEALEQFVWQTVHRDFYANKRKWFDAAEQPYLAMWWIATGTLPTLQDGIGRLDDLRLNGPSNRSFGWEGLPHVQMWRDARCA